MRVTAAIVGISIAVFVMQMLFYPAFDNTFALIPTDALSGAYWQFVTYMFLHGNIMHITLNMFVFFMFGPVVEYALGYKKYIALYILSGLGSAFLYMALTGISDIPMLGASGAVFGIMAAYGFMFPKNTIFIPPGIPVPAIFAVFALAGIELLLGLTGLEPGIANFGHLGGIITGILLVYVWKKTSKPRNDVEQRQYEFFWE